jgi:hypothetical protein
MTRAALRTETRLHWLSELDQDLLAIETDGVVRVDGYDPTGRPGNEVAIIEKARSYGAHSVFFEAPRNGRAPVAQALMFVSDGPANDPAFGELHKRLWSWGGVPLVYRKTRGLVQLFRCAHRADFVDSKGRVVCRPVETLKLAAAISAQDAWWDATRLRNGTLWDDPQVCNRMLSASKSAHRSLFKAVRELHRNLNERRILSAALRRRLLILSLLIAYLEERGAFERDFFGKFKQGATRFFEILSEGPALVGLLHALEKRFNGNIFSLTVSDRVALTEGRDLDRFAQFVEAHQEPNGQLTLWQLYSFRDLPVELISQVYQLFAADSDSSIYTPPSLVRLILEEALSWRQLDRLIDRGEVILDPACGSGVFLVEAYKRLVLHWRSHHNWQKPGIAELQRLLMFVQGIDFEPGAVELAAFSLCLALCDALEPEEIRASVKLFPPLIDVTLHASCFFEAKERGLVTAPIGAVVGNPPFKSTLETAAARRSYSRYIDDIGSLPDTQLAYLFLHEAMQLPAEGGILAMLQPHGFLYNLNTAEFRRAFLERWDLREILDFVSVRGLFQKGGADTKIVAIIARASTAPPHARILHAIFRRNGRADAEQGFDIDHYDLHWTGRTQAMRDMRVWRANLLGGGRVLSFLQRLSRYPTLGEYCQIRGWIAEEGFIQGRSLSSSPSPHIVGQPVLPARGLTSAGIDSSKIERNPDCPTYRPKTKAHFTPPFLLVGEHEDLPHGVWTESYLTYGHRLVGFVAGRQELSRLKEVSHWFDSESVALRAYAAGISSSLFTQRATALVKADILALPYPRDRTLDLSDNETILAEDIVGYHRDLIRLGDGSPALRNDATSAYTNFAVIYCKQIDRIYGDRPLRPLEPRHWPGITCFPFVFGDGDVDWSDADELRNRLDTLLHEQRGSALSVTRIARIYDGPFLYLVKPDRLRFWLRSVALRDADDTLADLRAQGF